MWLLRVLLLLPKVLLRHLLRALPAHTGCVTMGWGQVTPQGRGCWPGHPWQSWHWLD